MEIQDTHNRIRDRMAYLSATVKGASAMGQTDIHRLSETIVCPVLKIILDLPALRNLNSAERDNFPGIDLGDPTVGVGIQVTARADASKIRSTIRTCIRNRVHHTYPHLRFFVLTEKQIAYRLDFKDELDGKLRFDPQVDVLDYTDVLRAASKLGVAELSAVDEALARISHTVTAEGFGGSVGAEFLPREQVEQKQAALRPCFRGARVAGTAA